MNVLLAPINGLFLLTLNSLYIRCGYPCSHVLKVTNELTIDMIKVQNWKLFATHYNDESLGIGLELKNWHFNTAICMGVPITLEFLKRS
jgi:hypothetical protein